MGFGEIWTTFQGWIFSALLYLYGITQDWGMAIILLTVAIRVLLLPLTWKQTKSMVEMQRIQPKIKELNEKYKNDKEKLQEETLKFYQENKVNPFGGCLPLILQMPILIALYSVLGQRMSKGQLKLGPMLQYLAEHNAIGTFYALIPNIAKRPMDVWAVATQTGNYLSVVPYLLLVALFGVSIWLPQALMPGDKQQKMIGGWMAVMMLYFGWVSPAGVLLYWDVSSIWGLAQQQLTMALMKRETAAREAESQGAGKTTKAIAAEESVATKKPTSKKGKKR